MFNGDPGAIRTPDRPLRRRMLYPLSYGVICQHYYFNISKDKKQFYVKIYNV